MDERDNVLHFRNLMKDTFSDVSAEYDERDLARLESDDMYVLCFIHWRKGDIEAAVKMAKDVLKWRNEKQIIDLKPDDFELKLLQRGVIYVHGKAKDETILVHFIARQQTKDMKPQIQKLLPLWLESIQRRHPGKHITFLLDVSKASLANVDVGGIRFMLDCFTTYFPDMLEKILILEMPWIMNAIWKVVKQWMTEDQRKRTIFCSFKDLTKYIEASQLLEYMGGTDDWQYEYPPFSDNSCVLKHSKSEETLCYSQGNSADNTSTEDEEFVVNDLEITSTSQLVEDPELIQDESEVLHEEMFITEVPGNDKLPSNGDCNIPNLSDDVDSARPAVKSKKNRKLSKHMENEQTHATKTVDSEDKPKEDEKAQKSSASTKSKQNEVRLGHLLIMSPISEVVFQQNVKNDTSGRYQAHMTLANPNSELTDNVAFKVKTNAPDRYHVKPSAGKVPPDGTVVIRINLAPGHENSVSKDRFLVLYHKIDAEADVPEFWNSHSVKESRFEHRIRVRFEKNSPSLQSPAVSVVPSLPSALSLPKEPSSVNVDLEPLRNEVSQLRRQLREINSGNQQFQHRFRYFFLIQIFLVVLLFYALYKLSLLTRAVDIVSWIFMFGFQLFVPVQTKNWTIAGLPTDRPLIVAHRGSSGMRPEHTVAAYQLAVEQGADVIECDLAVTKDLQLICTHDSWLNATTDVHTKAQFRNRVKTYTIDGKELTDYFTVDFTMAELKTLRKIQDRSYRDQSYNGQFPLASFDEYVAVAQNISNVRTVAIYPETKNPSFFNDILSKRSHNTTMEDILLDALAQHGYTKSSSPCFVQSFFPNSIQYMSTKSPLPMVILTSIALSNVKLEQFATFCYGVGPAKSIIVKTRDNRVVEKTDFVERAHAHGLKVHPYTFRNEYMFLAWDYGSDPYREYEEFVNLGVDGLFTDYPWSLSNYFKQQENFCNGGSAVSCTRVSVGMSVVLISFVAHLLLS